MNCPECNAANMRTTETFKTPEITYRTKRCRACNWTFTSREELADDVTIPQRVRDFKRNKEKHE
jgi:hypothetical protein